MSTLVDDFENSFQNAVKYLTSQETSLVTDPEQEELKASAAHSVEKFVEAAKALELNLLKRRALLGNRQELQIIEEIADLKSEIARKDHLIQKHYEKLGQWGAFVSNTQTTAAAKVPFGYAPPTASTNMPSATPSTASPQQPQPPGPLAYLEQTASMLR